MQNDILHELGTNFIEYAVSVNTDRAIPESKSGLKPVARRILWGSYVGGRTSNKAHVKCARIVGDVMGSLHPHGDSSIYGALVRLAQPWVMRYPLIDFHGSCGNQNGDGAAAMRYTEARLAKITEDGMLAGIKKKNVDFTPTYDDADEEPITLPAVFPNLLCNPNTGIGVAIACNWLPHNLKEVANAIYDYIDGKEPMLPGPDFPTGGIVINKNDIPNIMRTGHGSIKLRGKYNIEKNKIVFYEIPYGVTIEDLLANIAEVCNNKEIEGISEIRDESNKKGIRVVIECQKGIEPSSLINKLFAKTKLQISISYNQIALVDKTPVELNLKDCCKIYVDHNIDCLKKELNFDLHKAEDRLHIIEGLLIALEDIDNVIALIKKSSDSAKAKEALITKYSLSEIQAKSILAMRLSSLAHMEKVELENEKKELVDKIADIKDVLTNHARQLSMIKDNLSAIVNKYGDNRRTELAQISVKPEEKEIAEVIPENVVVTLTQNGLIKKVPTSSFKVQRRGGKGVKSADESIMEMISTNTVDTLMFFTNKGKMYRTIVDNIPTGTNASKGIAINTIVNLENDERVIAMSSLYRKTNAKYVVFVTKQGLFKKTYIEEYMKTNRNNGIAAIKLKEGDSVVGVTFLDEEDVILITKGGYAIHFETKSINPIGRLTSGVKGIKLSENDEVENILPVHKTTDSIAIIGKDGLGKKMELSDFPLQGRGGKGIIIYKGADIVGSEMIADEDNLLLVGDKTLCISTKDIPMLGKTAVGNILIKGNVSKVVKL
jgi:DNA gyrase subunit A